MIGMGVIDPHDIDLMIMGVALGGEEILGRNPKAIALALTHLRNDRGQVCANLWVPGIKGFPNFDDLFQWAIGQKVS